MRVDPAWRLEPEHVRACLGPVAEMARAIIAACPEQQQRWSSVVSCLEQLAVAGAGWPLAAGSDDGADDDVIALIAACAAHEDCHPADWLRMLLVDRRITVADQTSKLLARLLTVGAMQVIITRDGNGVRVVAPTPRGLIEVRGETAITALQRAYDLADSGR